MNYEILNREELEDIAAQQMYEDFDLSEIHNMMRTGAEIKGVENLTDEELIEWFVDYNDVDKMIKLGYIKPKKEEDRFKNAPRDGEPFVALCELDSKDGEHWRIVSFDDDSAAFFDYNDDRQDVTAIHRWGYLP
jgi:hypothetical protein